MALACLAVAPVLRLVGVSGGMHNPVQRFWPLFGSWTDNALEVATLCLGG